LFWDVSASGPIRGNPNYFDDLRPVFTSWCGKLFAYIVAVDKVDDTADPFTVTTRSVTPADIATSSRTSNQSFSAPELVTVIAQVAELKQYVIAQGTVTGEGLAVLNEKMDYLIESSERLGKKDWYNILISTMFGIVINGMFAPDRARDLMDYGVALFAAVLQTTQLLQ
jgi:hypothetical protein